METYSARWRETDAIASTPSAEAGTTLTAEAEVDWESVTRGETARRLHLGTQDPRELSAAFAAGGEVIRAPPCIFPRENH
jgi:hypothetical protein